MERAIGCVEGAGSRVSFAWTGPTSVAGRGSSLGKHEKLGFLPWVDFAFYVFPARENVLNRLYNGVKLEFRQIYLGG